MKNWMLLIVSLMILGGCATTPPAVYINNEPAPKSIYTMNSTTIPVSATALFYTMIAVKDIDGDTTYKMAYLPINENLEFSRTEIGGLFVRFSVTNLQRHTYTVNHYTQISYSDGQAEGKRTVVGRSALDTRTFTISIPMPPKMEKASFRLALTDDKGRELLHIGDLKYRVNTPLTSR
jgi:hypothetical protein